MCNVVHLVEKTKQTAIKTRTRVKDMLRGRVVLQFRSEAIKTENPATVQCDAFQIDIFSRQEARHCLCQQLLC